MGALALILGLDTSTSRLAWAGGLEGPTGYFDARRDAIPDERRWELYDRSRALFSSLPEGSWVFCEEPLALAKNGKTTRLLGLAAGAIWAAHADLDITWVWVDAAAWRGKANGIDIADWKRQAGTRKDKEAIRAWGQATVLPCLPAHLAGQFETCPDLYDAWAIRLWGERMLPSQAVGPGSPQEARGY